MRKIDICTYLFSFQPPGYTYSDMEHIVNLHYGVNKVVWDSVGGDIYQDVMRK